MDGFDFQSAEQLILTSSCFHRGIIFRGPWSAISTAATLPGFRFWFQSDVDTLGKGTTIAAAPGSKLVLSFEDVKSIKVI